MIVGEGVTGVGVSEVVGVGVWVGRGVAVGVRVLVGVEVEGMVLVKVGVAVLRRSPRRLGMLQAPRKMLSQMKANIPVLTHFGWKLAQRFTMLYYTGKAN